jgi:hypothetical protein
MPIEPTIQSSLERELGELILFSLPLHASTDEYDQVWRIMHGWQLRCSSVDQFKGLVKAAVREVILKRPMLPIQECEWVGAV